MLTGPGHVDAFSVGEKGVVFALVVAEIAGRAATALTLKGGDLRELPRMNAEALAAVSWASRSSSRSPARTAKPSTAMSMKPANFDARRRYPSRSSSTAGRRSRSAMHWSYRWNPQTYAGAGYASVFIDFHGSPGYGQAFTDSISGDWGGKPLEDLQKGLAAALEKYPWLDGDRACALGASYGGYMMNWMAGNWSEPFKCFVNHAGIFDSRAMAYSTEELWFDEWEHGGPPFEVPENLRKAQSGESRREVDQADARHPRPTRLPRARTRRASQRSRRCNAAASRAGC